MRLPAALLLLVLYPVAQADYDAGKAAYDEQDYSTALKEFRALADRGVVIAYTNLGYMHALGEGTQPDMTVAADWFRKAAEAGDAASQLTLGVLYFNGEGVARDYTHSYAWLTLASENGRADAEAYLAIVTDILTPEYLGAADRLVERLRTELNRARR